MYLSNLLLFASKSFWVFPLGKHRRSYLYDFKKCQWRWMGKKLYYISKLIHWYIIWSSEIVSISVLTLFFFAKLEIGEFIKKIMNKKKTAFVLPSFSRFKVPSLFNISFPKWFTIFPSAGLPLPTISLATLSASIRVAPNSLKMAATVDFPQAMFPVPEYLRLLSF